MEIAKNGMGYLILSAKTSYNYGISAQNDDYWTGITHTRDKIRRFRYLRRVKKARPEYRAGYKYEYRPFNFDQTRS